jgi:hypothetical protein
VTDVLKKIMAVHSAKILFYGIRGFKELATMSLVELRTKFAKARPYVPC